MFDFLNYVESNYGCVAEYNRCMEERAEEKVEREYKQQEYYSRNKEKLKANENDIIYFADNCIGCPHYFEIGMTDQYDDVEHGICGNHECKIWKERNDD